MPGCAPPCKTYRRPQQAVVTRDVRRNLLSRYFIFSYQSLVVKRRHGGEKKTHKPTDYNRWIRWPWNQYSSDYLNLCDLLLHFTVVPFQWNKEKRLLSFSLLWYHLFDLTFNFLEWSVVIINKTLLQFLQVLWQQPLNSLALKWTPLSPRPLLSLQPAVVCSFTLSVFGHFSLLKFIKDIKTLSIKDMQLHYFKWRIKYKTCAVTFLRLSALLHDIVSKDKLWTICTVS